MFLLIELTWGGIRSGILELDGFDRLMNQVLQTVAPADSAGALINLSRTSDRHRSVGFGFAMFHLLRSRGYLVELQIHWNSSHWSEMARGGRNACCQDIQGSVLFVIWFRIRCDQLLAIQFSIRAHLSGRRLREGAFLQHHLHPGLRADDPDRTSRRDGWESITWSCEDTASR